MLKMPGIISVCSFVLIFFTATLLYLIIIIRYDCKLCQGSTTLKFQKQKKEKRIKVTAKRNEKSGRKSRLEQERMKYVEAWLRQVSSFKFIRIVNNDGTTTNNSNNFYYFYYYFDNHQNNDKDDDEHNKNLV